MTRAQDDTSAAALPRQAPVVRVAPSALPFSCPPADAPQWNLHPRVFLPLSAARAEASCPYCGTRYIVDAAAESAGDGGRRGGGRKKRRGAPSASVAG